jgi:hypothetical protein
MFVYYPQTKRRFSLVPNQLYYVPIKPNKSGNKSLLLLAEFKAGLGGDPQFVTKRRDLQDGSRRTIGMKSVDQTRPIFPFRAKTPSSTKVLYYPERQTRIILKSGNLYQVPILRHGKKRMIKAEYRSHGYFIPTSVHPQFGVKYTIHVSEIDQSRNVTKPVKKVV